MASDLDFIKTWRKRIAAAEKVRGRWEEDCRVGQCYDYWRGEQLVNPFDEFGNRRSQINKIHPEVRNALPSLYFYRPFARVLAQPELADTPGSEIDSAMQLLQDTANHIVRVDSTKFRETTLMALKEAFWAFGVVETGYHAEFKPPLQEKEDTPKDKESKPASPEKLLSGEADMDEELAKEKAQMKGERFYTKYIPSKQVLISMSDKAIIEENDWIGYWEDLPLQDVKESPAYENTADLKSSTDNDEKDLRAMREADEAAGGVERVRLYKIWDLRTKKRYVIAQNHEKFLLNKVYNRLPLHFLRFDIDPYHFFPRPPILNKLGPQDEYNQSREYLRAVRNGTVPRYTYDEDAVDAEHMRKLERCEIGAYIPRKAGTPGQDVISPVQQPSYSENAIQTLTLSDKEFMDVGGIGGDARVAQTKTATQAKIAEVKDQAQDSFDRECVAAWLACIIKELLYTAIDKMALEQWVAINVAPDSQFAMQESQKVTQQYQLVTAQMLSQANAMVEWDLTVDVESLSPVAEEQKFQKWMQGLSFIGNPQMAMVFSAAPELLRYTLRLMGLTSAREQEMIIGAMANMVQMQQAMAQPQPGTGSPPRPPGISPQPGGPSPGRPNPGPPPGGPQPGGPPGPGASTPS